MSLPAAILDSLTDSGQRHDRPSPDAAHFDALARRAPTTGMTAAGE
jgi:hypothetical protein